MLYFLAFFWLAYIFFCFVYSLTAFAAKLVSFSPQEALVSDRIVFCVGKTQKTDYMSSLGYFDSHNLDDMGVHIVNGILDVS